MSTRFREGVEYLRLQTLCGDLPQVVQFFSFQDPRCQWFALTYHVEDALREVLPPTVPLVQYHVPRPGPLGAELSRAWAAAGTLGRRDAVRAGLFRAVQAEVPASSLGEIRGVFGATGVKAEDFDTAWEDPATLAEVDAQQRAVHTVGALPALPTLVVGGRYQTCPDAADLTSMESYARDTIGLLTFLLDLG